MGETCSACVETIYSSTYNILIRTAGFLDFFHSPVFSEIENTMFRKLDLFTSSGVGGKTPTQLGPLVRANLIHRKGD
jgi:hypothetical protein